MTTKKDKNRLRSGYLKYILFFVILFVIGYQVSQKFGQTKKVLPVQTNIKRTMYLSEIQNFDGTDDNKPIYIGLNGLVYDVSNGRDFYNTSGPYHYLAGKDSSKELNIIGGEIIKRKYPVIARLVK